MKEATEVFKAFASEHGSDHLTLLTVYNQFTGILGRSSRKWSQINFCNHNALLRAKSIRKEMALQLKKSIIWLQRPQDFVIKILNILI